MFTIFDSYYISSIFSCYPLSQIGLPLIFQLDPHYLYHVFQLYYRLVNDGHFPSFFTAPGSVYAYDVLFLIHHFLGEIFMLFPMIHCSCRTNMYKPSLPLQLNLSFHVWHIQSSYGYGSIPIFIPFLGGYSHP